MGGRESHVYRVLAEQVPSLKAVLPKCYGRARDPTTGEEALFLEMVSDIRLMDASGAAASTGPRKISTRPCAPWRAGRRPSGAPTRAASPGRGRNYATTAGMAADAPLWRAIVDHGRARLPHVVTDTVWRRRHRLIDTIASWHAVKDRLPATLAHNDFNHRNVGFRNGAVVALDWELATRNIAHRDLVELLTFVLLPPSVERGRVDRHVEAHRSALVAAGVTSGTDRETWLAGFRCELRVEALNRVGLQLVFGAQFHLPYAERVNATIEHLLDLYEIRTTSDSGGSGEAGSGDCGAWVCGCFTSTCS